MKLRDRDLHIVMSRLPHDVVQLMVTDARVILAGGFIRAVIGNEEISDIDLFSSSEDACAAAANVLLSKRMGGGEFPKMHTTNNAITLLTMGRLPVQIIKRWCYEHLKDCADNFDYTVCAAAIGWNPKDGKFESYIGDGFYEDLAGKLLIYTAPQRDEDSGGSMLRAIKYVRRGYTIPAPSLAAVVSRLYKGVWMADDNFKEEGQRTVMITGILRAVDPLRVIDGVELGDEHDTSRVS